MQKKERIYKILQLAIPLFFEMLLATLLGTIDTLMIRAYDEPSVAAIGNSNTVLSFLTVLFSICSIGVSIVVSQSIGANKEEEAEKVLSQGILVNLSISIILAIFFVFGNMSLLRMVNTPDDIILKSSNYIKIVAFALPFQAVTACISSNLKAHSKPFYITITALIVNLINVGLNALLIFGNWGLPALGYVGAAIATLTCHIITMIVAIIITKRVLKQKIFSFKLNQSILKSIIKIGCPSALETICYNISQIIVIAQINKLLTDMIIARNYVNMILGFIYIFSLAFGNANAVLVGYSVGRNDYKEAKTSTNTAFFLAFPIVMTIVLLLNVLGRFIFPLVTENENVLNAIYSVLPMLFLLEAGRCTNLVFINALKSSGDTLFPVICGIFSMFLVAAFGSYLFICVFKLGLVGAFLASALDEAVRAILCTIRFKHDGWMNKSIFVSKHESLAN